MRRTFRYPVEGANSLWHVYKTVPFWKVVKNFMVIQLARYTPFMGMKNWLIAGLFTYEDSESIHSFALMVMPDVMFPEKITVGIILIGYNTTILAHEYLIHEYR